MGLFKKVKNRMVVIIIGFAVIMTSLMTFISITISINNIENEIHAKVNLMAERTSINVEKELDHAEDRIDDLGHLIGEKYKEIQGFDFENNEKMEENALLFEAFLDEIEDDFRYTSQRLEIGESIYFFANPSLSVEQEDLFHAIFLVQSGDRRFNPWSYIPKVSELDSEEKAFSWFYEPLLNGKGSWTDLYYNKYIGEDVFSYATPVYVNNKFIGIVGLDIGLRDVEAIVNSYNLEDSSYAILLNDKLDFLIHPEYKNLENMNSVNNGELSQFGSMIQNHSGGTVEYNIQGEDVIAGYSRMENGWYLVIVPDIENIYVNINKLVKYLLVTAAFTILVFILMAESLGDYIGKPMAIVNNTLGKLSDYKINEHTEIYSLFSYKDEIGGIAKGLSDLIIEHQELIKSISKSSGTLLEKGLETNENIANLSKINRSQNYSINNLKEAIIRLVTLTDKVYAEISSLSAKHNEFKKDSSDMLEIFEVTYRNIERDHSLIDSFSNHTELIMNSMGKEGHGQEDNQLIEKIMALINDIEKMSVLYKSSYEQFTDTGSTINKLIYNTHEILELDEQLFESIGDITTNLNESLMQIENINLNNGHTHKKINVVKEEVNVMLDKSNKLKAVTKKYR